MYRFFVKQEQIDMEEKKIHITGSDVNHIKNVLRMRQGETILISAGDNLEYTCLVSEMEVEEVIADISYVQEVGMELPSKIYLFQGLPKSDKMDQVVVHGPQGEEAAPQIVSAAFVGVRSEVLLHTLEERGIYVSAGSACSTHKRSGSPTLTAIGLPKNQMEATVRFSFCETTTREELDYTLQVLNEVIPMLRRYARH